MAVGLIYQFSGVGQGDYDAVNAKLGIDRETGSGWPAGLLSHAAGIAENGEFVLAEVWESREAQGRFMQERLGRALQEAGLTAVPRMTWVELFSYYTPDAAGATAASGASS
jgi:hypothetical protein